MKPQRKNETTHDSLRDRGTTLLSEDPPGNSSFADPPLGRRDSNGPQTRKPVPTREGILVRVLAAVALLALVGAFLLPFMSSSVSVDTPGWVPGLLQTKLSDWVATLFKVPVGTYYFIDVIIDLFLAEEFVIAVALLLFSVVFPVIKTVSLALLVLLPGIIPRGWQDLLAFGLTRLGKWSMADVFVVSLFIVFFKAEALHLQFRAEPGIYCYLGSALASSVAAHRLNVQVKG